MRPEEMSRDEQVFQVLWHGFLIVLVGSLMFAAGCTFVREGDTTQQSTQQNPTGPAVPTPSTTLSALPRCVPDALLVTASADTALPARALDLDATPKVGGPGGAPLDDGCPVAAIAWEPLRPGCAYLGQETGYNPSLSCSTVGNVTACARLATGPRGCVTVAIR